MCLKILRAFILISLTKALEMKIRISISNSHTLLLAMYNTNVYKNLTYKYIYKQSMTKTFIHLQIYVHVFHTAMEGIIVAFEDIQAK